MYKVIKDLFTPVVIA